VLRTANAFRLIVLYSSSTWLDHLDCIDE